MLKTRQIKVWDPLVRSIHWTLVATFTLAFVTEDEFMNLHVIVGYLVLGLLAIRLAWGFVGSRHARFTDFVPAAGKALSYLRDLLNLRARRYLGHNPAGGLMIIALLLSLLITALCGLATFGVQGFGPWADWFRVQGG